MATETAKLNFTSHSDTHGAMLDRARWAATTFARYDRAATLKIARAVAQAAHSQAARYAEWAVRETGFGVVGHKRLKNELCSLGIFETHKNTDWTGPTIDRDRKLVRIGRPAGVILALTPSTNPVATVFFKTILALLTRNAIIICPHPAAKACCADAADLLAAEAVKAGAPDGVIQVVREPSIPALEGLMGDERVDLVVATGGPAVVRAAYRSGTPALGVGPGNGPVYVDSSADLTAAAARIVESKSFDNSILCTNESVVLAENAIADQLLNTLRAAGAHVCSPGERESLRAFLWSDKGFNVGAIGKDAAVIARACGFTIAGDAKILLVPIDRLLPEEHFTREKLCPVLGFAPVGGVDEAIRAARSMTRKSGGGHSAAIHSQNETTIMTYAAAVSALRTVVNAPCSQGAAGFGTNLGPTMTIGTGFMGGSALGENLTPASLMNWSSIAYPTDERVPFGNFEGLTPWQTPNSIVSVPSQLARSVPALDELALLREQIRSLVRDELKSALGRT
ncbi:aldehyde dehydrogenase family protein [Phyllobacterium chamaecytisi]|uniref:aldehyde dehydrogenase family protein n=1 Tax=Phyllobacterium chamaecytisi TaxID=2876082 RepID=UPI001CC8EFA0|nr:aldehyde dehydrogenase family protein [Phyllobacterium sp. KW56]MBZ9602977.1 aldehyde dehydrogenase family protein [Phyllobacterium sp. KW56]